jgi:Predicted Na+-dependent transporter
MTGLLLIAACPAGGLSNYYTCLARANTALSVSLTAGSCVAALGTMPVVIAAYELYLGTSIGFEVPAARLIGSLVMMLVLPVLTGMALRHYRTAFVTRHETTFKAAALAGLTVLIAYVVSEEGARVVEDMTEIAVAGTMFVGLSMATGYAVGALSGEEPRDSFALLIEFAVRNVGIATAIAVTILGRVDFAVFAAAYFLIETPILFAAVILFKMKSVPLSRVSIPSVQ